MKTRTKVFSMLVVLFVSFLGGGVGSAATVLDGVEGLNYLIGTGNLQDISMSPGDNLMERVDSVDTIFNKGDGDVHVILFKYVNSFLVPGGYFTTDNIASNSGLPEYAAFMLGLVNRDVFGEADKVDAALAIYDPNKGQFGVLTIEDNIILDEGLPLWGSGLSGVDGAIEYEGILDGILTELVFPPVSGDTIGLGSPIVLVNPVPEPGVILLSLFGWGFLIRKIKRISV